MVQAHGGAAALTHVAVPRQLDLNAGDRVIAVAVRMSLPRRPRLNAIDEGNADEEAEQPGEHDSITAAVAIPDAQMPQIVRP